MNIEKWMKYVSIPAVMSLLIYVMVSETIKYFGPKIIFLDIVSIAISTPVLIFLYTFDTEELRKEFEQLLKK